MYTKKRDAYAAILVAAQVSKRTGVMQGIVLSAGNHLFHDRAN